MSIEITDPIIRPAEREKSEYIRDSRDIAVVRTTLKISLIMAASVAMVTMFVDTHWWVALIHWAFYIFYIGPVILMLHYVSHRPLFARPKFLNKYIPWVLASFFGQPPESYFAHHMSMHHRESNGPKDLSSTMRYQRDNIFHWLHYFIKFFTIGLPELCIYLYKSGFKKILRRLLIGELTWIAVAGTVFYFAPRVSIVVFIVPVVVTRFSLMAGNWAQHAFVDPERWDNDFASVTTFINSGYNRRCFNDGYHLAHHVKPGCHWSEMPILFESHIDRMKEEQSLVFHTIDYFVIWFLLMTHLHKLLAKYVVDLDPEAPLSIEEKVALIRSRLVPITI